MAVDEKTEQQTRVADEVWIATALLHREYPERKDFTIQEIRKRAEREAMTETLRPGVYVHIVQHCVANRSPNPGRYRMLFATAPKTRRLLREGDSYDPERAGSKTRPDRKNVPEQYRELIDWYERDYRGRRDSDNEDPILKLRGLGGELWRGIDPDDYVRRLREGWE